MAVDLSRGAFDQRITIKFVSKTKDASAGHNESYPTEIVTWAKVVDKGGSRTFDPTGRLVVFSRKDFYLTWRSAFDAITKDSIFIHNGIEYKQQAPGQFVYNVKHIIKYETVGI